MTVKEANGIISNIIICTDTLSRLQEKEEDPFFQDSLKMSKTLLLQYKALLKECIEKTELNLN